MPGGERIRHAIAGSPITRRLLGPPPAAGASREDVLRFVRRCAILPLPAVALVWIVVLTFGVGPTWCLIVMSLVTALVLANVASLSLRTRSAAARPRDDPN
jgi:hypothetical protein